MNGLNTTLLSSIRSQLVLVISFREGKIRLKGERAREKGDLFSKEGKQVSYIYLKV